jgi:hypothetical protein
VRGSDGKNRLQNTVSKKNGRKWPPGGARYDNHSRENRDMDEKIKILRHNIDKTWIRENLCGYFSDPGIKS